MGQDIPGATFRQEDFERFSGCLEVETALLESWYHGGGFRDASFVAGFELEGWLLDESFRPAPLNQSFLARIDHPLVVPELSTFNIELNGTPQVFGPYALPALEAELLTTWRQCLAVAEELESTLLMIGTLPTLEEADLSLEHMSPLNRYRALNERVLAERAGRPLRLQIAGREELDLTHNDVMLEAGTTSFQVHLQVPAQQAARYYNASQVLAAPLVAVAANSPYLFGRDLWAETRIPLFEQAVDVGGEAHPERRRVTFGAAYAQHSVMEVFRDNLERFPVLLPICFNGGAEELAHLRLHNGTLWRWNRPLVGFGAGRAPHLRIEHRVLPAGPTVTDMMANAALYYGAVHALAGREPGIEARLPFAVARRNFYEAARAGLDARIEWPGCGVAPVTQVLKGVILPLAAEGLAALGVADADIRRYLGVVAARVESGQNGAAWQRAFVGRYGPDFAALTAEYLELQRGGAPVAQWPV